MGKSKKAGKIRSFFADFKAFISKGNILDMAVGVIIGGAFGKIVSSLVNDIIMPLISLIAGGKSVEDMKWVITEATETTAEAAIRYGMFIQTIIDFLIIAFCIFLILRLIMNFKKMRLKEQSGEFFLSKPERKQLIKEFRAAGHSRKEAVALTENREEELRQAAAKEAEAAALAAEKAEAEKETTEQILKDIRELLKNK